MELRANSRTETGQIRNESKKLKKKKLSHTTNARKKRASSNGNKNYNLFCAVIRARPPSFYFFSRNIFFFVFFLLLFRFLYCLGVVSFFILLHLHTYTTMFVYNTLLRYQSNANETKKTNNNNTEKMKREKLHIFFIFRSVFLVSVVRFTTAIHSIEKLNCTRNENFIGE